MNQTINKIGFWSGLTAFLSTLGYVIVQLLQVAGILGYPLDEILIYGTSLCIVIPFVLEILALHFITPNEKKFWSHAALIFSILYSVFVTANYIVEQIPHSLFWYFDALGYIFMGLATLIAVPVFEKHGFQKWVRISFLANAFITPLIIIVYLYPVYSEKLLVLGFPWGITAPASMLLLAMLFRKNYRMHKHTP